VVEDPANPGEPNPDKVDPAAAASSGNGIRSILNDHELYVTRVDVNVPDTEGADYEPLVEAVARARRFYKGTGTPTFYTTEATHRDAPVEGQRCTSSLQQTEAELARALRVNRVVAVEVMEGAEDTNNGGHEVLGIIVNLRTTRLVRTVVAISRCSMTSTSTTTSTST
jgi:hypothetical protein